MVTINSSNEKTAASGKVMQGQGVGTTSNFSTATYPATATGTGKILRADGTNWSATTATYPDLAGTNLNVLTSDGTNWVSQAVAASSGGLTFLATQTAASSATVNFDNNLSATYDNYLVIGEDVAPVTNATYLQCQVGTGAGPTYQTTGYLGQSTTEVPVNGTFFTSSNSSTKTTAFYLIVSNSNSGNNKGFLGESNFEISTGGPILNYTRGAWNSATVLTSLRFKYSSGNVSTGTFKLYGFKN